MMLLNKYGKEAVTLNQNFSIKTKRAHWNNQLYEVNGNATIERWREKKVSKLKITFIPTKKWQLFIKNEKYTILWRFCSSFRSWCYTKKSFGKLPWDKETDTRRRIFGNFALNVSTLKVCVWSNQKQIATFPLETRYDNS